MRFPPSSILIVCGSPSGFTLEVAGSGEVASASGPPDDSVTVTVVVEVPLLPHPAITQPTTIRSANELFLITQELIWLRRMISTPARSLRNKSHSRNPTAIHDQSPVKDEAPIHAVTPSKGPNSGVLQRCLRDQPRPPTHYEPSDSVPGRLPSAGRPAADFGTTPSCGWPLVWTPTGDAILVFAGQPMQRKCTATPTMTSSGCCLRRRLRAPVGFPAALSIGRLHGASCERRGSAIGSGFSLRSWSAGSASKRLPRRLHRRGG